MAVFVRELLTRGHEVTAITSFHLKPAHSNYTEVLIDPPYDLSQLAPDELVFNVEVVSPMKSLKWIYDIGLGATEHALKTKNVREFIAAEGDHYDAILIEQFSQEAFLMLAHKFGAPIIALSTMGYADYMDSANGLHTPLAYCPNMFLDFDDRMTFWQRLENVVTTTYERIIRHFWYMPANDKLADKYFAALKSRYLNNPQRADN